MQTIKTFIKDHPHMWWGLYLPVYLGWPAVFGNVWACAAAAALSLALLWRPLGKEALRC